MKKILFIIFLSLLICSNTFAKKNITRSDFFNRIENKGNIGFVLRYHNEKNPNKFEIILPKNSPPIISDYHSRYGVLGGSRSNPSKHGGIDFYQEPGEKILAAADGKVYGVKKNDKCVGNQFAIYFGKSPDGTKLYATHMHVGTMHVKKGDEVKRGQHVADAGELVKSSCGGGMEHLHFHMSKRKGTVPNSWGSWRFLGKPSGWINPHKYWTGGAGKPECFVEGKEYPEGLLTLPVECKDL
jgi:murein DD-endopeptidase MepM/ murein hydrolase activator NlpD